MIMPVQCLIRHQPAIVLCSPGFDCVELSTQCYRRIVIYQMSYAKAARKLALRRASFHILTQTLPWMLQFAFHPSSPLIMSGCADGLLTAGDSLLAQALHVDAAAHFLAHVE